MSKWSDVVIVMARCSKTHLSFGMRFEETSASYWSVTWAFALEDAVSRREGYDQTTIAGRFGFDEAYPGCPHCRADNLVKCVCGKVSCRNQQSTTFTCPWCGDTGEIRGTIEYIQAGGDR